MKRGRSGRAFGDESGVALALAIIVMVVAGVMGAGLLLLVRNELEAGISSSNARRALYAADAGTQLAARHILSDPRTTSYDDAPGPGSCRPPDAAEDPEDSLWSHAEGGVARDVPDGGDFTAGVLALGDGCDAPEARPGERYFRVFSEGRFGETRRLIEATYATRDIGAPLAVYAAGDVRLGPESSVSGGSVFAGGNVALAPGATVSGKDPTYSDWSSGENGPIREETFAAIGAAGEVSGASVLHYDATTRPAFVSDDPAAGELTFPFDPAFWNDEQHRAFMEEVAREQDNYSSNPGLVWPEGSSENTVVYAGEALTVDGATCPNGCRGTLVAAGGAVIGAGVDFSGAVISPDGSVVVEEGASVRGFVVSGGDLELRGAVDVPGPEARLTPGHFGLEVYGWREPSG
ncbi:hypothetical protein [Rubrobacter indicoceani]|uniref:hypothetical protein n=1 Tax=Rubrobacter indicoceani TaxID=2051957 RepID=UPI000E5AC84D|nr:hypothetical protein [Rubrobacter indicoceani]